MAEVLRPSESRRVDVHRIGGERRDVEPGDTTMARTNDALTLCLPEAMTWAATLDPQDGTREIEITDEMVRQALDKVEDEQIYPFCRKADTASPVARTVRKADVIPFRR